jgi:hypothetical protein
MRIPVREAAALSNAKHVECARIEDMNLEMILNV